MIPVKGAREREVGILGTWVGVVSNKHIHPCFVSTLCQPCRIKIANGSSSPDKVAVVEVVIVIVSVAEINTTITSNVGAG